MENNKKISEETKVQEMILKYKKPMEKMYYFFLAVILLYAGLSSTPLIMMGSAYFVEWLGDLPEGLPDVLFQMLMNLRFLIVIPAIYTILFEVKSRGKQIMLVLLLALGWFYAYYWRDKNDTVVFEALLLIVASAERDFRKIAKYSIVILSATMLFAFAMYLAGIFPDYTKMRGDKVRHSFGTIYCTDLAAHWGFIILTYVFLKEGRMKWPAYAVMLLLTILNVLFVDGRTAYMCVLAAMAASLLAEVIRRKQRKIPEGLLLCWRWLLCFSFIALAAFYLVLNVTYENDPNAFYNKIGFLHNLSNRLETSRRVTTVLPFSWFGKYFLQLGDGMGLSEKIGFYTFLDDSYIRVYVMYGVVALTVFLGIFTAIQYRLLKAKKTFQMFIIALVAFSCFLEHHMLEVGYNIFMVLLFAGGVTGSPAITDEIEKRAVDITEAE